MKVEKMNHSFYKVLSVIIPDCESSSLLTATITVMIEYFTSVEVFNIIMYYFNWDRANFLHRSIYRAIFCNLC